MGTGCATQANMVRDRTKLTFYGRATATDPDNQWLCKRAHPFCSHSCSGTLSVPIFALALSGAHMCPGTLSEPNFAPPALFQCPYISSYLFSAHNFRAPSLCQYVFRHHFGAHMCPGSIPVYICARAPFRCPYVPGYLSIPLCACTPFRGLYVPWHHFGAHMYPGTISVPISARAPFRCPNVPGQLYGAHRCSGTILVFIYMFPGTSTCPYGPRYPFGAHMFLGTLLVPIYLQAPYRCPYMCRAPS